jgi:ABC-type branched-subunit amino acid transport system substrate-binding protein
LADLIKKYDPDIILFSSYFELSNELLRILSKYDLKATFIFSSSFDDKDFFNSFLKRDNVYMCSLNVDKKNEALYGKVATEYKKFYSKPMDLYSFMAYESYIIFYEALKNCVDSGKPVDRKNINYYIQKIGKSERFKDAFRFKITKLSDLIISRHEGKYKEKK